jgi:DNA-binding transcriptional LysR family regulator
MTYEPQELWWMLTREFWPTLTSLDWLGDHIIAPIVARFGRIHPLVEIEPLNDTRVFNISRRDADIAFRFGTFEQEDLVLRKVADAA